MKGQTHNIALKKIGLRQIIHAQDPKLEYKMNLNNPIWKEIVDYSSAHSVSSLEELRASG